MKPTSGKPIMAGGKTETADEKAVEMAGREGRRKDVINADERTPGTVLASDSLRRSPAD
jgi:hypothetical protein